MTISHTLTIHHCRTLSPRSTPRTQHLAALFGLDLDEPLEVATLPPTELPVAPGTILFVTGPSGGGKSTILRCLARACRAHGRPVVDLQALVVADDQPLVETFPDRLDATTRHLARAGLADARDLLKTPSQLSGGQYARYLLARAMAGAGHHDASVILADEFASTLDRVTAVTLCRLLRRWITETGHTLVAATTRDDLLADLQPDAVAWKPLGDELQVVRRTREVMP